MLGELTERELQVLRSLVGARIDAERRSNAPFGDWERELIVIEDKLTRAIGEASK